MENVTHKGINLVKETKFFLFNERVRIHLPLPNPGARNWYEDHNYRNYTGIVYKGVSVSLTQLDHIVKCFESVPSYQINELVKTDVVFDGKQVTARTVNDIRRIIDMVKKLRYRGYDDDEYIEYRKIFNSETKTII